MEEVPFEDRYVPKAEIDWGRSLWWWYPITRAIHPAMRITALFVSAAAVWFMWQGIRLADWVFSPRFRPEFENWYIRSLDNIRLAPIESGQSQVFLELGLRELAYLTFCGLWLTLVLGWFGGILSRRAAIELGQRTIAPWGETIKLVTARLPSYLWVTGMHLVTLLALLLIPHILGWFARLGPLAFVMGLLLLILWPLVFAVGRMVVSMIVCFPLAVTAISCERNADAFEGFSRSNNYFFQRPVLIALCVVALYAVGWVGYQIIFWWLLAGWHWMRDAFLSGAGLTVADLFTAPGQDGNLQAIRLLKWIIYGAAITWWFIGAYLFSYFWSATAAVYLIVRRSVDSTDLDDIETASHSQPTELPTLPPPPTTATE